MTEESKQVFRIGALFGLGDTWNDGAAIHTDFYIRCTPVQLDGWIQKLNGNNGSVHITGPTVAIRVED